MKYKVSDFILSFAGENDYFKERFKDYIVSDENYSTDMNLTINIVDKIHVPEGDIIIEENTTWIKKKNPEEGYYLYIGNSGSTLTVALMDANKDWSEVKILAENNDIKTHEVSGMIQKWNYYHTFIFSGIAFRNRLIEMDGISIHSSAISYKDNGILFSAPSGTGKSTHANLWKEKYGKEAIYVNDDRPAIRYIQGTPFLFGVPWSGKTEIYENVKVPLKMIVLLQQSSYNEIVKLSEVEAMTMLLPRCFLPFFDENMMDKAMSIIEKLLNDVPVYVLKCKPDFEAVEMVNKCLI